MGAVKSSACANRHVCSEGHSGTRAVLVDLFPVHPRSAKALILVVLHGTERCERQVVPTWPGAFCYLLARSVPNEGHGFSRAAHHRLPRTALAAGVRSLMLASG